MTIGRFPAAAGLGATMLAAAGLLTACTAGGGQPQSTGHHQARSSHVAQVLPSSPAASAPAPSPSASMPQPTPVSPQPVAAASGQCTTGDLHLSVGAANGAAGSFYYPLQLTNTSGATCTMYGYPGAALVSKPGGSVVGAAAVRNPTFPAEVVTLAPGAVAHATLQVAVAGNYSAPACGPTTAHWLQVYPPGQYAPLFVSFTAQTCRKPVGDGSTLGIYVVRPGATGP